MQLILFIIFKALFNYSEKYDIMLGGKIKNVKLYV